MLADIAASTEDADGNVANLDGLGGLGDGSRDGAEFPGLPAGVIDRSVDGGRDGAALIRIDPIGNGGGHGVVADPNFLSQRSMDECQEVVLLPLTPLQVTSAHVDGSVVVLQAVAGRAAILVHGAK